MLMGKYIFLCIIVLNHDDLFCPEEGTKLIIEVHLLLVSCRFVTYPQVLGIGLESDIEHA